jgi:hypothetical protein
MLMTTCRVLASVRRDGLGKDWSLTVLPPALTDARVELTGNSLVLNEAAEKDKEHLLKSPRAAYITCLP